MIIQPGLAKIEGFVKIHDPSTGEILVDKKIYRMQWPKHLATEHLHKVVVSSIQWRLAMADLV